ncbi:hypothetical protein [Modestobacter altitudinis]|uniref:hypothetical protein n=1 Tax=Modestobacter altitudinis TaxID=2213158 RepID=UPI001486704B|nr:hypothetical protein [Modestobacter altitudinis]
MIGLVSGLVLLIVVAVVLVVTLGGGDDDDTVAAGSSSSDSSAPATTASPSSSPSPGPATPSPSGGFTAAPSGGADVTGFVGQLPVDFDDCADAPLAGDGDVAAAACGSALTQPGPEAAAFYLYPDQVTLDSVFSADVTEEGLAEFAVEDDCSTGTGYGEWTYSGGEHGGQVACQIAGDGYVVVAWTDDEHLTEGVVRAPGTTQAEVSALYDWWTANSEYQG